LSPIAITPDQFSTFGELLRYLRRQARITQRELAIAVGYSDTQISRIEQNQRVPDSTTITALFVPALYIEQESKWVARLLELAKAAQVSGISEMDDMADIPTGAVPLTPCGAVERSIPLQMKISRNIRKPGHSPAR
jgi:transcriptional regulator with XRE-family HTH domain